MNSNNAEKAFEILNNSGWFNDDISKYQRMMDIVLDLTNAIIKEQDGLIANLTESDKEGNPDIRNLVGDTYELQIANAYIRLLGLAKFFDVDMDMLSSTKIEEGWVKDLSFKEFCYHVIAKLTDAHFKREQKVLIGLNLLDTYCQQNNIDIDWLVENRINNFGK